MVILFEFQRGVVGKGAHVPTDNMHVFCELCKHKTSLGQLWAICMQVPGINEKALLEVFFCDCWVLAHTLCERERKGEREIVCGCA